MSDMTEGERHRALVFGLVGAKNHHRYMTSMTFRAAIESLSLLLPPMIDGLAAAADGKDEEIAAVVEQMKTAPIAVEDLRRLMDSSFRLDEYEGTFTPPEGPT